MLIHIYIGIDSRAPLSLLNIQNGQLVQLVIQKRLKEKWVRQPTPDAGPFAGSGNRLGATATTATAAIVSVPVVANSDERREISTSTTFEVDPNAPVTSLQLRLRDGTRFVSFFFFAIAGSFVCERRKLRKSDE